VISRFLIVLAVTLGVLILTQDSVLRLGILERLELASLDYRFSLRGATTLDSADVVIVEIAEDTFRSIPERYPWPRSYYAHLLRNLKQAGARVVAFDLIFGDPDNHAVTNDSLFRTAIRETDIAVLAGKRERDNPLFFQTSATQNYGNIFYDADSTLGLVNVRPDADGVYRTYNVAFLVDTSADGTVAIPTFGFAALNKCLGLPPKTVPELRGSRFVYAGRNIPAYDGSSVLVNYYGPNGTFRHIKFQDVLDDETFTTSEEASSGQQINTFSDAEYGYLHDGTFKDKIILVGVTVPEYKDLFPVPVGRGEHRGDNLMYGVEIHANLIQNVLHNEFLYREPLSVEILTILLLVLITIFGTSFIKEWKTGRTLFVELIAAGGAAGLIVLAAIGAVVAFQRWGMILSVIPAVLAVAFGHVASTTWHFVVERKQRILIKSMFSTYVHPQVVDELVKDPSKLVLGGKREELTVMFTDLEGFTAISQDMQPERLVALLNEYLSIMSDIVIRNRGTLDKYVGDAIMAFWGAPIPQSDHAILACRTALQMNDALESMNQRWHNERKPQFVMRIGINTGPMVVGNMGATGKFAYTVMGDSVNLASRLEGANRQYQTRIMVSESTYQLVKEAIFGRKLDRIAVKGRSAPVTIYELIQTRDTKVSTMVERSVQKYQDGLTLYLGRRFTDAACAFEEALTLWPDDAPSQLFLTRAREYAAAPPPSGWDGVYVMKSK
jgi:adenylate cyclase